jgi:Tol biopolymer transport system component
MRIIPVIVVPIVVLILGCVENNTGVCISYLNQNPPGKYPSVFAPDYFSEFADYRDAVFTPDGTEFYFTQIQHDTFTIMTRYFENGKWTDPVVAPFSGKFNDFEPCISIDGKCFYFASMRPSEFKPEMENDIDIWRMDRESNKWGEPQRLDTVINTGCMEYFPSVTKNKNLVFGRNNLEMTRGDVYISKRVNGKFIKPVKLPEIINLPSTAFNAFIAPDESYIIFSTYIQNEGKWHSDLFISFMHANSRWSDPVNMKGLNSSGNDHAPSLSPDGKYLFFASTRNCNENKKHQIFWVDATVITDMKLKIND